VQIPVHIGVKITARSDLC